MPVNERQINIKAVAIARFAKFIDKYYADIDWTLAAQACGVIDLLDKHERVRRAKFFGDTDYVSAVSSFILAVFKTDEQAGISLVNEIVDGVTNILSQESTAELQQILEIFGGKQPNSNFLLSSLTNVAVENLLDVIEIPDDFYKKLIDEVNHLYRHGFVLSLSVLVRKLLENLLIDVLRKRYGTSEISLYYDISKRRFLDFSVLIKNIESKQLDFQHITGNLDNKLIAEINSYRETGNSGAHSIDVNMKLEYFKEKRNDLNYLVQFLFRLLKNI